MAAHVKLDKRRLTALIQAEPGRVEDALDALAFEGQRLVVQSFGTSPPGRSYAHGRVTHVASVKGYPPNVDTGALKNAIHVEKPGKLRRIISTGSLAYAFYLEFGTRRMAARPFMGPMADALRPLLPDQFKLVVKV